MSVLVSLVALPLCAHSEGYPERPIRLVVATGSGGTADLVARLIGQKLTETLGQQVIIDNRPGAGGVIGMNTVARANPDGYTLLLSTPSFTTAPALPPDSGLPFDPIADFSPITQTASQPYVLVVNPTLGVRSVKELIHVARARPGQINFSSSGVGAGSHLVAELFKVMASIDVVHVPYKGSAAALVDTVSGQVQMMFTGTLSGLPVVKSGKLRALGVTTVKRSRLLPDVPAIAEAVPGYDTTSWSGVLAPAGTPKSIVQSLNKQIVSILQMEPVVDRLASNGSEPLTGTPEEFSDFIRSDIAKWKKLVKDAGIKRH
ncbi:MAG: tripartite tricarboxylate transporter substrate binding protein [Betaproteobacteria bacterium]|nr:tripartite tricarboxylate transporter substrate binding protein [Betaproteobacteria bacterium]